MEKPPDSLFLAAKSGAVTRNEGGQNLSLDGNRRPCHPAGGSLVDGQSDARVGNPAVVEPGDSGACRQSQPGG